MRQILLRMQFLGTNYCGYGVQKNGLSIQQVVQDCLEKLLTNRPQVKGCSRTDAGVHANEYYLSFVADTNISNSGIVHALNNLLPWDICVLESRDVDINFHVRYNCTGKEYVYIIHNSKIRDVFWHNRAYRHKKLLDEKLMNDEIKSFVGVHDFRSFMSLSTKMDNTVREIYDAKVERNGDFVYITIRGNGFLHNMVRIIAGTLIAVSDGRIPNGTINKILDEKNRNAAGPTAPAEGLYLNRVFY